MIVLSHYQATPLLEAKKTGATSAVTTLDLGLTQTEVEITSKGVLLPDNSLVTWETLAHIQKNDAACFTIEGGKAEKIYFFSQKFNRFYSLRPTLGAPTMLMAGFPMHRIKDVDPHEDTLHKVGTIAPVLGAVLDTTTGLGYTAIEAAKTAASVTTIELDPTALKVCAHNPWSRNLFENPKIKQLVGSSYDIVPTLPKESFRAIIHDPPTFKLAGELYSGVFYTELARVLRRDGKLFHYIGDLDSHSGSTVAKGVIKRLRESGFAKVVRRPEAFGLVATK